MLGLIPDALFAAIGAGLVGMVTFFLGKWLGNREGHQKADTEALRGNINTRAKMDEAEIADDHHHAIDWLSKRDPKQR